MAIFKTVWQFKSQQGDSWSEVLYRTAGVLGDAASFPKALIDARRGLLHDSNTLVKIRVSDLVNSRVTTQKTIGQVGFRNAVQPATVGEALVLGMGSSDVPASRRMWLRGFDKTSVARNVISGALVLDPEFQTKLNNYFSKLAAEQFSILVRGKVLADGVLPVRILSVDGTAGRGQSILTLDGNPLILQGQQVNIARASNKELPGLNGNFTVVATGANTLTVNYRTPENQLLTSATAKAKRLVYKDGAIIDKDLCGVIGLATRKSRNFSTNSRGAKRGDRTLRSSE